MCYLCPEAEHTEAGRFVPLPTSHDALEPNRPNAVGTEAGRLEHRAGRRC
jgi:hypothetical protein